MTYEPPITCSLHPANGGQYTTVIQTRPEGIDHPVIIGWAGDCPECEEASQLTIDSWPFPGEIVTVEPFRGNPCCKCEACYKFRSLFNDMMARSN